MSRYNHMSRKPQFFANGPAIWGGCVTRRSIRAESRYPAAGGTTKLSRCKEGMAHFLTSGYKFFWALRVSRYKFDRSQKIVMVQNVCCGHLRSVAVQVWSEPVICQGTRNFIAGRCACPGLAALRICLRSRSESKKCDKQLTHIVRVRFSCCYFFLLPESYSIPYVSVHMQLHRKCNPL